MAVALLFVLLMALSAKASECRCDDGTSANTICLTPSQMAAQVKHFGMANDSMSRSNGSGIAEFALTLSKAGKVENARAVSGEAIPVVLLMSSVQHWRFRPYMLNGKARKTCGILQVEYSLVNGRAKARVVGERSTGKMMLPRNR